MLCRGSSSIFEVGSLMGGLNVKVVGKQESWSLGINKNRIFCIFPCSKISVKPLHNHFETRVNKINIKNSCLLFVLESTQGQARTELL